MKNCDLREQPYQVLKCKSTAAVEVVGENEGFENDVVECI